MKKIFTFLAITISLNGISQFSTSVLDYNNVSALITDGGILFNNQATSTPGYEIPKNSGMNAIYSTAFWFGGQDVNGQWRMSATHYEAAADIFPGPIANPGEYTSTSYLNNYLSSIWTVEQADINNHISNWNQTGYVVPTSIENWPGNGDVSIGVAEQLAPYVDMNANNIYEPALGDYPNIRGDIATYVIMNDAAQVHTGTISDPIIIEVHLMLYQYTTTNSLNDVTFINTRIFNRGTQFFQDFKSSIYADGDLGNYSDDYYGCDSVINMIYTYNGDNFDEDNGGALGYGVDPPAIGIMSLNQAMSGACYYSNGGSTPMNDPSSASEHWNFMNNQWGDGTPWVYGGNGYPGSSGSTTSPTNYIFGGDPTIMSEWSETSTDLNGSANAPNDRRMLMNLPSTVFQPGDSYCYDFAVVYGRGNGSLASVQELKINANFVQSFYDNQNYSCEQVVLNINEIEDYNFKVYPNPTNGNITVSIENNITDYTLNITNLSGQIVYQKNKLESSSESISLNIPSGIYFINVQTEKGIISKKLIVK